VNVPTRVPLALSIPSTIAHVDPFPFVPATCTTSSASTRPRRSEPRDVRLQLRELRLPRQRARVRAFFTRDRLRELAHRRVVRAVVVAHRRRRRAGRRRSIRFDVSFRFDAFVAAARANSTPSIPRIIFISRFAASAIAARSRARASRDSRARRAVEAASSFYIAKVSYLRSLSFALSHEPSRES
jgi:hypothetical protein